jgi:hypothetical protein
VTRFDEPGEASAAAIYVRTAREFANADLDYTLAHELIHVALGHTLSDIVCDWMPIGSPSAWRCARPSRW